MFAIDNKKVTIKFVQQLTGTLNFLNRAIIPGHAFTRCMYSKLTGKNGKQLKQHHHVYLNADFLQDCWVWVQFLKEAERNEKGICRPFIDFPLIEETMTTLNFFSDASKKTTFGIGAVYNNHWIFGQWPENFIIKCDPSIEFLELYRLTLALYTWRDYSELNNGRICIYCDNQAVQHMVNNLASSCVQCMKLI